MLYRYGTTFLIKEVNYVSDLINQNQEAYKIYAKTSKSSQSKTHSSSLLLMSFTQENNYT